MPGTFVRPEPSASRLQSYRSPEAFDPWSSCCVPVWAFASRARPCSYRSRLSLLVVEGQRTAPVGGLSGPRSAASEFIEISADAVEQASDQHATATAGRFTSHGSHLAAVDLIAGFEEVGCPPARYGDSFGASLCCPVDGVARRLAAPNVPLHGLELRGQVTAARGLRPVEARERELQLLPRVAARERVDVRPATHGRSRRASVTAAIVTVRPHAHTADSRAGRAVQGEKSEAVRSRAQYGHDTGATSSARRGRPAAATAPAA